MKILKKVAACVCSVAMAMALTPAVAFTAYADEAAADQTSAFTLTVNNALSGQTQTYSFTQAELDELASGDKTTYTYGFTKSDSEQVITTSKYVLISDLLQEKGVSLHKGDTFNAENRTKGDPYTYEMVEGDNYYQTEYAPAVLALSYTYNGEAQEGTRICVGSADGKSAQGNQFWTNPTGLVVESSFFSIEAKSTDGTTSMSITWSASDLNDMAAENTTPLTYAFAKGSDVTTITATKYVKLSQMLEQFDCWNSGVADLNFSTRTKGSPFTYDQVEGKMYYGTAEAPAIIALERTENGEAATGIRSCFGTADGSSAAGNMFWTNDACMSFSYILTAAPTVKDYTGTYNGKAHGITATATEAGSTLEYWNATKAQWVTTAPTYKTAGYYEVNVRAVKEGQAPSDISWASITIKKASQKVTVATSQKSKTAAKGKYTSKVVTKSTTSRTYAKCAGSSKYLTITKAGKIKVSKYAKKGSTYKIKVKVTAKKSTNYNSASKTFWVKVKVK